MNKFKQYDNLDLSSISKEILDKWNKENTFEKSVSLREGAPSFTFYEGPPSANGMPGIHHVMARTIKDIFCRYHTMKGSQVKRKGGWDTHGLPIELGVEKMLGITKDDIGKKISIEDYNAACRKEVMKYKDKWEELTLKMGYWVDLHNPYVTFENNYIESVWYLLKELYKKSLLYKGYTIQPYSPAAGTGLSSHELNQPGTYRQVKDTSCTAMFKVTKEDSKRLFSNIPELKVYSEELNRLGLRHDVWESIYMLAWTTTPWTLPANTALAVGENIEYCLGGTINPYTKKPAYVIFAKERFINYFPTAEYVAAMAAFHAANPTSDASRVAEMSALAESLSKAPIPIIIFKSFKGSFLSGTRYIPLFDDLPVVKQFADNNPNAFHVIIGDFVSTEDGTGLVHISPTFGADDKRVADKYGIKGLYVTIDKFEEGSPSDKWIGIDMSGSNRPIKVKREAILPIVDRQGKYVPEMGMWAGRYVKDYKDDPNYQSLDIDLCVHLKQRGLAFKVEKYEHSYPHCWRTDKPVIYYPLDSWFVKTTLFRDRMIELNKTINWKPEATGTGRFGNWLENLVDWNLSRSRFWGIPLPVWRTEDASEEICIGSVEELNAEIKKAVAKGFMSNDALEKSKWSDEKSVHDLHRPYVDNIVLVSPKGKKMYRETDLIDVWFDSGSMPYSQWHWPFENKEAFNNNFPADFIAEGVDQTRGWFFTLHAIATMLFDSVAYKNVVSNGLVLDKHGNKMSKRLGNAVDPFQTLEKYSPDATRWYMISNAQPWDNLKFDEEAIGEVQRKFFRALYNTYAFYALYANIDGFSYKEEEIQVKERAELDRWILSVLVSLIKRVDEYYSTYEPMRAARDIENFVTNQLSNWYVRLSRRRFWKGEYSKDKIAAYQTLYVCLETISKLIAPIAPFYAEKLFTDLNRVSGRDKSQSVHHSLFPQANDADIDNSLEERMDLAQRISSLTLALRKDIKIRVRQPLSKILIPILDDRLKHQVEAVKSLILAEVNVKSLEYITDTSGVLVKKIKPNYKELGKKLGPLMKEAAQVITGLGQEQIREFETNGVFIVKLEGKEINLQISDVEILSEDIPGWHLASDGKLTVALDITLTKELKEEGWARELVNRIQNLRKDRNLEVTDKINLKIKKNKLIDSAIENNFQYICAETLAESLELVEAIDESEALDVEVDDNISTSIFINKYN